MQPNWHVGIHRGYNSDMNHFDLASPASMHGLQQQNHGNFYISGGNVHVGDNLSFGGSNNDVHIHQKLLRNLIFPQMYARAEQISSAYPATCEWLLRSVDGIERHWDSFKDWLLSSEAAAIYWIHGKPGSGKSTMMKYVDNEPAVLQTIHSWTDGRNLIKASYYFWKAGNSLQRSVQGMYRCLLFQILHLRPEVTSRLATDIDGSFMYAEHIDWSTSVLRQMLQKVLELLSNSCSTFLVIDGLDECEEIDEQEELVDFFASIAHLDNLKVCISSRLDNLFKDAFLYVPQLRLEDLTRADIQHYVTSVLQHSRRWAIEEAANLKKAHALIVKIMDRTQGVFLWATLATRDILRALSDGDSLDQLEHKLNNLPADLNQYFDAILKSIPPEHRREASVLLQLALFKETTFASVFSLHLVDTIFVVERDENFALDPNFDMNCLNLKDKSAFSAKIDANLRRLSSRCRGLLEIGNGLRKIIQPSYRPSFDRQLSVRQSPYTPHFAWLDDVLSINVNFLHRSLRDFLLLPHNQEILHSYTDSKPFDSRQFLINARLVQLLALTSIGSDSNVAVGLASHLLSALSVNGADPKTSHIYSLARTAIEWLAENVEITKSHYDYWYINDCLEEWGVERSNFLTLAIDFRLTSYVLDNMTADAIRAKEGRPILSYVLQPRFQYHRASSKSIFSAHGDLEVVKTALARGADPDKPRGEGQWSVWAVYLCDVARTVRNNPIAWDADRETQAATFHTLSALIEAGASPMLPLTWLSETNESLWKPGTAEFSENELGQKFAWFATDWDNAFPVDIFLLDPYTAACPIGALLKILAPHFQWEMRSLIEDLDQRKSQLRLPRWGTIKKAGPLYIFTSAPNLIELRSRFTEYLDAINSPVGRIYRYWSSQTE